MGELDHLAQRAAELVRAAEPIRPDLAAVARRIGDRLTGGQFHIAIVGEFSSGKSTLVNALLGAPALPMGVVPLTAVRTEVVYGTPGATVVELNGHRFDTPLDSIATFVSEGENPANVRGVDYVEVRWSAPFLQPGVVLVDTPGIGSLHVHNTETGHRALHEADGVVLVLSADAAFSAQEHAFLKTLIERDVPVFVVVNKADHVLGDELTQVRRFVCSAVSESAGSDLDVFFVAARAALRARTAGREVDDDALEWSRFVASLTRFVHADLEGERARGARMELTRVAEGLRDEVLVRAAAAELDVATLQGRVAEFRAAAAVQQREFADDRLVFTHEIASIVDDVRSSLRRLAREESESLQDELAAEAARLSTGRLEVGLRAALERAVRDGFEECRAEAEHAVAGAWQASAERLRQRTQSRINVVRASAADLLEVHLPGASVPRAVDEPGRFLYLFVHVGSSSESLGRLGRRLLPQPVLRRRLLRRAQREAVLELDKHAGRAGWDFDQRLGALRERFERDMELELDRSVADIVDAAARADEMRVATVADRACLELTATELLVVVERVLRTTNLDPDPDPTSAL